MRTKQSIIAVGLVAVIFLVGASIMPPITTPVVAQQNRQTSTKGNMSSVMMESVRMHLKAADKAMSGGNPGIALEQMNLAQMRAFNDRNEENGNHEPISSYAIHEGRYYEYESSS